MASFSKGIIIRAQRSCCVVGCYNSEVKNPELHFYRFPGRKWEVQRKQMWIDAVNRPSINNKPWIPKDHTRVCSAHFVGGKKSEDMHSEAYVPSIFPNSRKKGLSDTSKVSGKRSRNVETLSLPLQAPLFEIVNIKCEVPELQTSTFGCQTDPWFDQPMDRTNILFCWNSGNESSTQTEIYVRQPFKRKRVIVEPSTMVDKLCGSDEEMNHSIWRFSEITTNDTIKQLTGMPYDFFALLLSLIMPNKAGQPAYLKKLSKEDRLFLFLLKMKLGLSFGALGCLFHVQSTTASRIFFQILETLTEKTKNWIFWPMRENAKKYLPSAFNKYPNCRGVLTCMEVRTETPSSLEQKLVIYSNNASTSITKFLLGITQDGYVCKISKGYEYKVTNSFMINDSGFLDVLQPGDTILADKSFKQIETDLAERGATLIIPQSIELVNDNATKKACVGVHINRAIQKLKLLRILEHFSMELLSHKDSIMHMCCVIANGLAFVNREKLTPQIISPH